MAGLEETLTGKIGPLPTWGWMGIFTAAAGGFYLWQKHKSASSSSATSATAEQQLLAAEEAAAANAAQATAVQTPNYNYGGRGRYNWSPAASTTSASTGTTSASSGTSSSTATSPVQTTVPAGSITSQQTVTVPNCAGMDAGAAHNAIVAAGLVPTAPAGQRAYELVASTTPAAGTAVMPGSSVQINTAYSASASLPVQASTSSTTAAAGKTVVPDCAGQTCGTAHNMLVAAGLTPTAAKGQKATQKCTGTSPAAGTSVAQGSAVTILT